MVARLRCLKMALGGSLAGLASLYLLLGAHPQSSRAEVKTNTACIDTGSVDCPGEQDCVGFGYYCQRRESHEHCEGFAPSMCISGSNTDCGKKYTCAGTEVGICDDEYYWCHAEGL